jgi:catechol 2,3-dioxygenase-like lactoylglutathione lyase family enzyme
MIIDHIGLAVSDYDKSKQFFCRALAAGGTDNGPPGIREIYHPDYYGAFVIGPDGHNVEAVCHRPEL